MHFRVSPGFLERSAKDEGECMNKAKFLNSNKLKLVGIGDEILDLVMFSTRFERTVNRIMTKSIIKSHGPPS